jgi:hypothetical protein
MGQAEHLDSGARAGESVKESAETEGLIIGMGHHRQH